MQQHHPIQQLKMLGLCLILLLTACGTPQAEPPTPAINRESSAQEMSSAPVAQQTADQTSQPPNSEHDLQPIYGASELIEYRDMTNLEDILSDPEAYIGKHITVRGDPTVIYDDTTLSIADNANLKLNEILIANVPSGIVTVSESLAYAEPPLIIAGTVQRFELDNIEPSLGINPSALLASYDQRPIIVAEIVQFDRTAVPFEHILIDYDLFNGQEVTLNGLYKQPITGDTFSMQHDTLGELDSILVVMAEQPGTAQNWPAGQPIRVQGTLTFVEQELLQERLAATDLDNQFYEQQRGEILIIAKHVWAPTATQLELATLLENPQQWYGRQIELTGQLQTIADQPIILLQAGSQEIPIAASNEQANISAFNDGDTITVRGVVRPFRTSEVFQSANNQLDPVLSAKYRSQPMLVITSINSNP